MQTENDHQKFKNDRAAWYLFAEYSLSQVPGDEDRRPELTAGPLFQTMRKLGLPPVCLKRIQRTITETAQDARDELSPGRPNLPVYIRLFCLRKMIDSASRSVDPMNGGWGFYVIERGRDFPDAFCQECDRIVEIYLYKEGE